MTPPPAHTNSAPAPERLHPPDAPTLLPADVRPELHQPHATFTQYATDLTGAVTYRLNSAGYRGEELNPKARLRLCLVGESHAFGVGVTREQTFGHRLKTHIATALGWPPDAVNLVNLALAGQSGDYCVRTAYRQLPRFDADLLIAFMPFPERVEYCWPKLGYRSLDPASLTEENLETAPAPLLGYADFYTDRMGHLWLVKNMLALQDFCRRHQIDCLLANQHLPAPKRQADHLACFDNQLDDRQILGSQLFRFRPDRAADRTHGGPRTHAAFAIALLDRYAVLTARKGDRDRADKLAVLARKLKATDPDWAFCHAEIARMRQEKSRARAAGQPQGSDP